MLINAVAPFAGAWIEIPLNFPRGRGCRVAPFAGAWIEIQMHYLNKHNIPSLPSRERGLKLQQDRHVGQLVQVAPFAGAWIEIPLWTRAPTHRPVAPFAGAWIEIEI